MVRNRINQALPFFTIIVSALLFASPVHAIPAFSRAHKVECTTCHTIAPELNEYGDAFLKNSYVYVGKVKIATEKKGTAPAAPVAAKQKAAPDVAAESGKVMGEGDADKLNKLKAGAMFAGGENVAEQSAVAQSATEEALPADAAGEPKHEGLALSGIPEIIPISFTGSLNYGFNDNRNHNEFDYSARAFKLHAGGNFSEKIGFFASYTAYSEQPPGGTYNTSQVSENNKTNLGEMFVQLRSFLGTPVNLKIGRMQPKLGLWKTNNKLSATNNYLPYTYSVGDESIFKVEQFQDVIELNTVVGKRLFIAGGMVNRKGQNLKEGYGHVSYKIGGVDYMGDESDVDLSKDESILDFLALTIGGYGYYGENGSSVSNTPRNNYRRVGVDSELQYKIYRLRLLGGWGEDDNVVPSDLISGPKVISKTGAVDAEITLLVNLIAAARFEYLKQEGNNSVLFSDVRLRRYVGTLAYAPLQNFKLSTEIKYELYPTVTNRIGVVGATFSF